MYIEAEARSHPFNISSASQEVFHPSVSHSGGPQTGHCSEPNEHSQHALARFEVHFSIILQSTAKCCGYSRLLLRSWRVKNNLPQCNARHECGNTDVLEYWRLLFQQCVIHVFIYMDGQSFETSKSLSFLEMGYIYIYIYICKYFNLQLVVK
jgi:hypothetical protein